MERNPMKPTQKIQLEIYKDKIPQFYLALLEIKLKENPPIEIFRKLSESIHLDAASVLNVLEFSEEQEKKLNDKLKEIHTYLLKSRKDSEDYFKVSKENFEEFQNSQYVKILSGQLKYLELIRQWSGKEESAELRALMATVALFLSIDFAEGEEAKRIEQTKTVSPSLFENLNSFFDQFLKLPKNNPEQVGLRDKIILSIYAGVEKFYPEGVTTFYVRCIITGFICSQMGWLETENFHISSKRKQTYRKYLIDTVGKTLLKFNIK